MHRIERKNYGCLLTFGGALMKDETVQWTEESERVLRKKTEDRFSVTVDMRTAEPLAADAQEFIVKSRKLFKERGMAGSVVVLDNVILSMQFKRLACESGISLSERYVIASKEINRIEMAMPWVRDCRDSTAFRFM